MKEIPIINMFAVGVKDDYVAILSSTHRWLNPTAVAALEPEQAINLAAWLVANAGVILKDSHDELRERFLKTLDAVEST